MMLAQRVLTAAILLPIVIGLIFIGGWAFTALVVVALGLAAWEYSRMFQRGGFCPSALVVTAGVVLLILARMLFGFVWSDAVLALAVLVSMTVHVVSYQLGQERAATDFVIDLGGILYLGWLGGYFISLRNLPGGLWLMLLALPAVMFADAAAYFIGRPFGRHKIAPRVSPGKSWEGYLAGILFAIPATGLLATVWAAYSPGLTFSHGALLGCLIAVISPLGDFGESMIKRQLNVKDSSQLIPGHGGLMDRIDSWLWAVVISYYLTSWFW